MKKLPILVILAFSFNYLFAFDANELTGDAKTACEVILCLASSAGRPAECNKPLAKYFALQATPHKSLSSVRADFLKKCPDDSSSDSSYDSLKDTLKSQDFECTAEEFNLDKHKDILENDGNDRYRTMSAVPKFCEKLASEEYSDLSLPRYTCDKKWYDSASWQRGYELSAATKQVYDAWLASGNDGHSASSTCDGGEGIIYYKHIPFTKDCWVNTGSKSGSAAYNSDSSYGSAANTLNEIKNSAEYSAATKEIESMTAQEKAKYQTNVNTLKQSDQYKNYNSSLNNLKQSDDFQNYGRSLEALKQSDQYQNYRE